MPLLHRLIASAVGAPIAERALSNLEIPTVLSSDDGHRVSSALFAMALNAVLFDDLLRRVPSGAAYVADVRNTGRKVVFDHGALRTIRFPNGPTGQLPSGRRAFSRILEPLGYKKVGVYALPGLKMTGFAFAHEAYPAQLPQFFVSELHVARFSDEFRAAAKTVFGATRDPLPPLGRQALREFRGGGDCSFDLAVQALPQLSQCFQRSHPEPCLENYQTLLAESAEGAWIATEGQAFNHATDRVDDVEALAAEQRRLGRPVKDKVEVSASGTVLQTAYRADPVQRTFRSSNGDVTMAVPGSFFEFITRKPGPKLAEPPRLDLRFDSGNAQGIFQMTAAA